MIETSTRHDDVESFDIILHILSATMMFSHRMCVFLRVSIVREIKNELKND